MNRKFSNMYGHWRDATKDDVGKKYPFRVRMAPHETWKECAIGQKLTGEPGKWFIYEDGFPWTYAQVYAPLPQTSDKTEIFVFSDKELSPWDFYARTALHAFINANWRCKKGLPHAAANFADDMMREREKRKF